MSYDQSFYDAQRDGSLNSAREVVPLLLGLVHPSSVVDVGCGVGTWLRAFMDSGIRDAVGVDGDYAKSSGLVIPDSSFEPADLTKPLDMGRRFDLAISLEVGEHLPASAAGGLVDSLIRLAPVVAFSAAIPFQGGTNHINEQWQGYWAGLFRARGYVAVDAVRPAIWNNDRIEAFYRQNILLYVDQGRLASYPALASARERTSDDMLSVIHPKVFSGRNSYPMGPISCVVLWVIRRAVSSLKRVALGR